MNTKKALAMLSKGERVYETHSLGQTLADKSDEYLGQYAARDQRILNQQQSEEVALPFLQTLRKKVSNLVSSPDESLTVVTRFDLYAGIKKISERSQKDIGLKRLSVQLEKTWHEDPVGGLTYGQVKNLVRAFKNDFPRSNAADAIEAECARVGLHKLPVAKLARIAAKIGTQADFETAVIDNKLAGDKPDQIRARTLIRSLVAMKSNRTAQEMVSDSLMSKSSPGHSDLDFTMKLLEDASTLAETITHDLDQASMEAFDSGMENAGQELQNLSMQLNQWMGGLTDLQDSMQLAPDPQAPEAPGSAPAPKLDGPAEGPEEEPLEELAEPPMLGGNPKRQRPVPPKPLRGPEHDEEDAGLGKKKLMDPRTWFASRGAATIKLAKAATRAADLFDGEFGSELLKLAEVLNAITGQLAPLPEDQPMGMEMPLEEGMPGELGMELPPDAGDSMVQAPELDMGVNLLQEIEQAADEIIMEAPPEATDYIQHEMGEGHLAPPGTAEWGAEEILNEGHEFAPPTEGWLQEEEQELGLGTGSSMPMPPAPNMGPPVPGASMGFEAKAPPGMESTVMKLKKQYPGEPDKAFATAWSIYNKNKKGEKEEADKGKGGRGIPLPKGKIKSQPEVTTYAKKVSPDGGKTLKASDIEDKLLEGKTLKLGNVLIRINTNDEVELWEKGAGRACALADLDVAIADFMAMTGIKVAQAAPPAAPAPAAPASGSPPATEQSSSQMPAADVIKAGLTHYKAQGLGPLEAVNCLLKDYKDREDIKTPDMQNVALAMAVSLWTNGAPTGAPPADGAAPAAPPPAELPAPVSMAAAVKEGEGKMKTPSIRKPKDHVSVPKDLGEDSSGKDLLPSPGTIKSQPNKDQGQKMSPTDLGEDSSTKDLLPDPGKPKAEHPPTDQSGVKLPSKKLDKDLSMEDPFKTPALGSSPSPRKK